MNPRMLAAQRELAGLDVDQAARVAGVAPDVLVSAERGEHALTSRQARKLAERYGCSLAYLYLEPTESGEETAKRLFRHFRDVDPADAARSPELRAAMAEARDIRDLALELLEVLGDEPSFPNSIASLRGEADGSLSVRLRRLLGVSEETQGSWESVVEALRSWRAAVESVGALTMQSALVPRRSPDPGPVRGFVLPDETLPVVVLNRHDVESAQVFTLLHEFVHAVLIATRHPRADDERYCDTVAAAVLMPTDQFMRAAAPAFAQLDPRQAAERVARRFHVSLSAAVVRAADLSIMPWDVARAILSSIPRTRRRRGGAGRVEDLEGRKVVNAYGRAYTELVVDALQGEMIRFDAVPGYLRRLPAGRLDEVVAVLGRAPLG